jgi:hypothetical protein
MSVFLDLFFPQRGYGSRPKRRIVFRPRPDYMSYYTPVITKRQMRRLRGKAKAIARRNVGSAA